MWENISLIGHKRFEILGKKIFYITIISKEFPKLPSHTASRLILTSKQRIFLLLNMVKNNNELYVSIINVSHFKKQINVADRPGTGQL